MLQEYAANGQFRAVLVGDGTPWSAPDDKLFYSVANRRDGCTMVPFLRAKRKFRLTYYPSHVRNYF